MSPLEGKDAICHVSPSEKEKNDSQTLPTKPTPTV
jgi:hypothetical protein